MCTAGVGELPRAPFSPHMPLHLWLILVSLGCSAALQFFRPERSASLTPALGAALGLVSLFYLAVSKEGATSGLSTAGFCGRLCYRGGMVVVAWNVGRTAALFIHRILATAIGGPRGGKPVVSASAVEPPAEVLATTTAEKASHHHLLAMDGEAQLPMEYHLAYTTLGATFARRKAVLIFLHLWLECMQFASVLPIGISIYLAASPSFMSLSLLALVPLVLARAWSAWGGYRAMMAPTFKGTLIEEVVKRFKPTSASREKRTTGSTDREERRKDTTKSLLLQLGWAVLAIEVGAGAMGLLGGLPVVMFMDRTASWGQRKDVHQLLVVVLAVHALLALPLMLVLCVAPVKLLAGIGRGTHQAESKD